MALMALMVLQVQMVIQVLQVLTDKVFQQVEQQVNTYGRPAVQTMQLHGIH
jgi:hypothetical protein